MASQRGFLLASTSTQTKSLPPDHDLFVAWCGDHEAEVLQLFQRWFPTSPFNPADPLDDETCSHHRVITAYGRHLKTAGLRSREAEDLRHYICRCLNHVLKGKRFRLTP